MWHAIMQHNNVCNPSTATHYNKPLHQPPVISLFPLPKTVRSCSVSQGAFVCNTGCYIGPTQFTEVRTRNSCLQIYCVLLAAGSAKRPFRGLCVWFVLAPTCCVLSWSARTLCRHHHHHRLLLLSSYYITRARLVRLRLG